MLGIMFQKIWSKKWMIFCLLLGSILLTATMVSFPLYESAVFDKMLRSEFRNTLSSTGSWPSMLSRETSVNIQDEPDKMIKLQEQMSDLANLLGVTSVYDISLNRLMRTLNLESGRIDINIGNLRPAMLTELPEHAVMLSGQMYSEDGLTDDGYVEVVISESCMNKTNLLLGDVLQLKVQDNIVVSFKITGIFRTNEDRYYWENTTNQLENVCLMHEDQFRQRFLTKDIGFYSNVSFLHCLLFDFETLKASQVSHLISVIDEGSYEGDTCIQVMEAFQKKQPLISTTLFFLEVPVLILLGAFLFMVSGQMYEMEKNEISVIKSRGSSSFQIFRLYLYQNLFLTVIGTVLGLPLGFYFVRILGSASSFLEFGLHRNLEAQFDTKVFIYLAIAVFATVLIMTLPAIKHSKVSIVHLKQKKSTRKRPLWEYFFLDFICLGIGGYGFYSYTRGSSQVMETVMGEQSLDPLLYLASSLFIVGAGLLFLRLQPLLVKLVYIIGKRFWRPASYASFQDSLRNGRKQQFIMLFLILTVSLGTFYATVARTILQNTLNNVEYLDGTDIIFKEIWKNNSAKVKAQIKTNEEFAKLGRNERVTVDSLRYENINFFKYSTLDAKNSTKVYYANSNDASPSAWAYFLLGDQQLNATFMGINTKEFGEITWLDQELLENHYYTYLNTLASNPNGILVSRNFQTQLDLKVGDELWCGYQPLIEGAPAGTVLMKCKILDFVDYWPTFTPTSTHVTNAGEVITEPNYLIVANIATFEKFSYSFVVPYEVWMSLDDGMNSADIVQWINDNDIKVEKYIDMQADKSATIEDPLLQGTNGILTMSFLVMILLCAVGYLIYWVMSIRSRELIFGTLRAFGMHKKELFHMLILEQIFSGLFSLAAGMGIGKIASQMYVPLLQTAYAAANQVLPIQLLTDPQDMVRLYGALALMMLICLTVLALLVLRLNITKALKLGEE